jgi:predicted dipeptidase
MENALLAALTPHLEAQKAPLKQALVDLVRIPSVCDEGGGGYPFGEAIDRSLVKALEIADSLGFATRYGDSYYGLAEIGRGKEILGILGHLDVVSPGNLEDWATDPFDPIEREGLLYGRGAQDDKGPLLAALFAVKALMDVGVTFNKRVRFIFGADGETLWRCIKRYNATEERPTLGFTPDSRFPFSHVEKGVLQLHLVGESRSGLRLSGGSTFNTVPDSVVYDGERQHDLAAALDRLGFDYTRAAGAVEVLGQSANAMEPERGVNAIARLCIALRSLGVQSAAVRFIADEIGENPHATRIFGACADRTSGRLKVNVAKIEIGDSERIAIDCRLPVTVSRDKIVASLSTAAARHGLTYRESDWLAPVNLPTDHFLIRALSHAYSQISGDLVSAPFVSDFATYARAIDNCVAFGALFPDEPLTAHQPNERVALKSLHRATAIYAQAIYELTCAPGTESPWKLS